jgi:hypothetical protein
MVVASGYPLRLHHLDDGRQSLTRTSHIGTGIESTEPRLSVLSNDLFGKDQTPVKIVKPFAVEVSELE